MTFLTREDPNVHLLILENVFVSISSSIGLAVFLEVYILNKHLKWEKIKLSSFIICRNPVLQ